MVTRPPLFGRVPCHDPHMLGKAIRGKNKIELPSSGGRGLLAVIKGWNILTRTWEFVGPRVGTPSIWHLWQVSGASDAIENAITAYLQNENASHCVQRLTPKLVYEAFPLLRSGNTGVALPWRPVTVSSWHAPPMEAELLQLNRL